MQVSIKPFQGRGTGSRVHRRSHIPVQGTTKKKSSRCLSLFYLLNFRVCASVLGGTHTSQLSTKMLSNILHLGRAAR